MYTKICFAVLAMAFLNTSSAQNGATGTSGGYSGYQTYINYAAALGEDQQVTNSSTLTIGANAAVDLYGALQIDNGSKLELLNGAVLNLYGDITINGTLSIESGATLNYYGKSWINGAAAVVNNNGTLSASPGNAVNFITPQPSVPATFVANTAALSAYGGATQAQNISGAAVPMNIDLHVKNNQNILLSSTPTALSGRLSFDVANGYIINNANNFIFTETGSYSGASTDRYIQTNNATGEVIKQALANGSSFTFPIGFSIPGDYTPARVTVTGGSTDDYHAAVNDFTTSPPNEEGFAALPNMQRTWKIYSSYNNAGNTSVTIDLFHYQALEQNGYNHNLSSIFQLNNAGNWRSKGYNCSAENISTIGTTTYYAQNMPSVELPTCAGCSSATNGTYFTKSWCSDIILAVKLLSFNAKASACNNLFTWQTAGNAQNTIFYIEESTDGVHFFTAAQLPGSNTTYQYTITNAGPGKHYYRLKIAEAAGSSSYSKTVLVNNTACNATVQMYPNPVRNTLFIQMPANYAQVVVKLLNGQGNLITSASVNGSTHKIDMKPLPAGIYYVQVFSASSLVVSKKIIKQ